VPTVAERQSDLRIGAYPLRPKIGAGVTENLVEISDATDAQQPFAAVSAQKRWTERDFSRRISTGRKNRSFSVNASLRRIA
jgi:hypothetical protein